MSAALHLTFDDGPDPAWTPRVLEVLAGSGAAATFFVLGSAVRRYPELVAQILAAGHTVGSHGDEHVDHRKVTAEIARADTQRGLAALEELGVRPSLWRLPWGRHGDATVTLADEHGLRIVDWDADTHDWRGDRWVQQPDEVTEAAATGGIVLLHDAIGPGATRTDCANTLEITAALVRRAAQAGTAVTALTDIGACNV